MLNTEWKLWDKVLNHLIDKEINILELGVYKGYGMQWFIDNLLSNEKSIYIGVDIYEESNNDFDECHNRIKKSGKKKQINIINKNPKDVLYDMQNKNLFDVILINTSAIEYNVFSDCVLSWNILKYGGILINDDNYWNIYEQEYFRPKDLIESFIRMYSKQCDVLQHNKQVLIRKKLESEYKTTKIIDDLLNKIRNYKPQNWTLELPIKEKEELNYELTFMNKPDYIYYNDDKNITKKIIKLKKNNTDKKILQNSYFCGFFDKNTLDNFHTFYKDIINNNEFVFLSNFYLINEIQTRFNLIELFNNINKNNIKFPYINYLTTMYKHFLLYIKKNYKSSFLNKHLFKYIKNNINKNIKDFKFTTLYATDEFKKNNIINNNNIIHINYNKYNKYNIKNVNIIDIHQYNKDIILYTSIYSDKKILYKYIYYALFYIIIGLKYQSKGGIAFIRLLDISMDISLNMLEIIRNYYENVKIIILDIDNKFRNNIIYFIIAENFRGINKKELNILYNMLNEIKNKKLFFNIFPRNLLNTKYVYNISKFNNSYNTSLVKNLKLFNNIYNIINNSTIFNVINIKKVLLQSQLNYLLLYLGKNKILDYI